MRFASLIPALIVIAFMFFSSRKFNVFVLYRLAFPLTICGFFIIAFIPDIPTPLLGLVIDAGDACVTMLVLLMVCTISYSTNSSPIWLFGILGFAQLFFQFAGGFVGAYSIQASETIHSALVASGIILIVVTSFMLFSEKNLFSFWEKREPIDERSNNDLPLKVRCLGASYGFTERETEVVQLASKGRTNAQIARDMFTSEGTVKVHLHHVYQKTGVHSRKELLALIDSTHKEPQSPRARKV